MNAAMRPVQVEGWTLFAGDGGGHWMRDLDLAERAELAAPRNIRAVIKTILDDGIAILANSPEFYSARGECTVKTPSSSSVGSDHAVILAEKVMVPIARGGAQEATEYYLNLDAALHVLMRLRTPVAVKLQIAMVRVFTAVLRGEVPAPSATMAAPSSFEERLTRVEAQVAELTRRPTVSTEERPSRAALRQWLSVPGRTQGKLGAALGATQQYIGHLTRRGVPSKDMAKLLEAATGIAWQGWFTQEELGKAEQQLARARALAGGEPAPDPHLLAKARHILKTRSPIGREAWIAAIGGKKEKARAAARWLVEKGEAIADKEGRTMLYRAPSTNR
jgi:hypothetical protein